MRKIRQRYLFFDPETVSYKKRWRMLTGNLYSLYCHRDDCSTRGDACAVLAPGKLPNKPGVNIPDYHLKDDPLLLRGLAEQCLAGVFSHAVVVATPTTGLFGSFSGASTAQASPLVLQSTRQP